MREALFAQREKALPNIMGEFAGEPWLMKLVVTIPAYNEEKNIAGVIEEI